MLRLFLRAYPKRFRGHGLIDPTDPNAPRPVASGVSGDGRQSDVKYGKMAMDIKIDYAVKQIQEFLKSVGAK